MKQSKINPEKHPAGMPLCLKSTGKHEETRKTCTGTKNLIIPWTMK